MTRYLSFIQALRIQALVFYFRCKPETGTSFNFKINPRQIKPAPFCFRKSDSLTTVWQSWKADSKSTFVIFNTKIKNKINQRDLFDFRMSLSGMQAIDRWLMEKQYSVKQHLRQPLLVQLVLYKSYPLMAEKLLVKNYSGLMKKF
ncbi:MAG: hypothetical protein AAFZ15_14070 [Bacteroidota bacterium]